ncbi:MAG: 5-carboxymethyl-2-hydroxymuconate Delta-isomerase [Geminicoccaceae bacterium]
MPHIAIEYSANLEEAVDMHGFCETLRIAGIETGIFPMPGIRVRAHRCDHYAIADGASKHGFIDIAVRLREGRPQAKKEAATAHLFATGRAFLVSAFDRHSIALSMEMRDIDARLSPKHGTIRDHLGGG